MWRRPWRERDGREEPTKGEDEIRIFAMEEFDSAENPGGNSASHERERGNG